MPEYLTHSSIETAQLGKMLGESLPDNSVVCFFGDLGAGKTTFIKGLASTAAAYDFDAVNSPTFVYLNIYEGKRNIFHFDLYRLNGADDFIGLGFDEYLHSGGICCIEWSERIASCLPKDSVRVEMAHLGGDTRKITITPWNPNA